MSASQLATRAVIGAALLAFAPASLAQGALGISPPAASVSPGQSVTFKASGGSAPYVWSLSTNGSGGTISASGKYVAGKTANAADVVKVTDAAGASATASVGVAAASGAPATDASRPPNN